MNEIDYTDNKTQEMVLNLLHVGETTVIFTKKDGTERSLKCTLKESLIPSEMSPKGSTRVQPTHTQAVFDIENNGWRSFTWDSIIEVSV
jgi:hypothetical protein